jgi:hypothetical protein
MHMGLKINGILISLKNSPQESRLIQSLANIPISIESRWSKRTEKALEFALIVSKNL